MNHPKSNFLGFTILVNPWRDPREPLRSSFSIPQGVNGIQGFGSLRVRVSGGLWEVVG